MSTRDPRAAAARDGFEYLPSATSFSSTSGVRSVVASSAPVAAHNTGPEASRSVGHRHLEPSRGVIAESREVDPFGGVTAASDPVSKDPLYSTNPFAQPVLRMKPVHEVLSEIPQRSERISGPMRHQIHGRASSHGSASNSLDIASHGTRMFAENMHDPRMTTVDARRGVPFSDVDSRVERRYQGSNRESAGFNMATGPVTADAAALRRMTPQQRCERPSCTSTPRTTIRVAKGRADSRRRATMAEASRDSSRTPLALKTSPQIG